MVAHTQGRQGKAVGFVGIPGGFTVFDPDYDAGMLGWKLPQTRDGYLELEIARRVAE